MNRMGLALVATCALVLASCGSSSATSKAGSGTELARSWVTPNASEGAAILTWTIAANSVSGSVSDTYLSSSGDSVHSSSASFSGTVSGGSVNLDFSGTNVSGTVTPSRVSISFQQSNGQFSNLVLVPGTVGEYNREVAEVSSTANANEQAAQAALQAQQQAQAAAAQASSNRRAIRNDASTVTGDLSQLTSDESQLATDVSNTQPAVVSEQNALARTKARLVTTEELAKQYGTGSGNGVCSEAEDNVAGDAQDSVEGDATDNVEGDATDNVLPGITSVQSDITQLQSDFSILQTAEANMPGYVPNGTPTQGQVQSAVSNANGDINNAVSTMNSYIAQANAYVTTAYGYVATAYQVGNCGSPPSLPTPVPPISASEAANSN